MNFKYQKLRGRIIEKFGTLKAFSKIIGISYVSLSNKMRGKTEISTSDIVEWSKYLDISIEEYGLFYFT